jgi:hypothetical protein
MPPCQDALGGPSSPDTAAQRRSLISLEATNFPNPKCVFCLGFFFVAANFLREITSPRLRPPAAMFGANIDDLHDGGDES